MYRVCYTYIVPEIKFETNDLITISKAARLLKVTRMTVYAMISRGQLHRLNIADNPYLLKEEVEKLQKERAAESVAALSGSTGSHKQ